MAAGTVTLPVRVACGDKLIVDAEIKVPVVATVNQDDTGVQVQVSADMPELREALADFLHRAADKVATADFANPVDCHSTHSKPSPTPLEQIVDSVSRAVNQR